MTHECLILIGADGPTFIEGPLSQDSQYAQMLAAVTNRPVFLSNTKTGTSVGAAMLIRPPQNPPEYTSITVDDEKRHKLEHYAQLWKRRLSEHCC